MFRRVLCGLGRFRFLCLAVIPAAAAGALTLAPLVAAPIEVDKVVLDAQSLRLSAIKKVHPAVVAVCMPGGQGVGSGVVISADGFALTNFHVVQPTGPLMQAGLADGVLYDAVLVGQDKVGDVALIKLLPKEKGKPFLRRGAIGQGSHRRLVAGDGQPLLAGDGFHANSDLRNH